MNKKLKTFLITVGVIAAFVLFCVLLSLRGTEDYHEKYAGVDLTSDVEGMERAGTYSGFLKQHSSDAYPDTAVSVNLFNYTSSGEGGVEVYSNYEGVETALFTEVKSEVTWTVEVAEAGLYNLEVEYLIPESHGVAAERSVKVNGEYPFDDAENITLTRIWTNGGAVRIDNQGNQIRPTQVEVFDWQMSRLRDDRGYVTEPYMFYFEKGTNTITFGGENEPLIIKALTLSPVAGEKTYQDYLAECPSIGSSSESSTFELLIQGEDSTNRSESSLYAKYDRSSPTTSPNSVTNTVLNYIGGETWSTNGQWIEWEFEVPADGYYNIMIKGRQNYARGSVSNRMVYIDGVVPLRSSKGTTPSM